MAAVIQAEHLSKRFGKTLAVNDVSFEIEAGEVFGFLGPNGAGKTTTINMLCTLLRPTSGRALVCGHDVVKEQNQVRHCIGLVFQDPSLDERMTAWDNLEFHAVIYQIPARVRKQRMEEVLRLVELWERRRNIVRTFSGGMKRRLELARGLLHYPQAIFLDEPTLGLDPQTRAKIWEFIHKLRQEEGITIFLTTHYMDEAENTQRIAIIDRGQIIALDTPEALKRQVGGDIIHIQTADDNKAEQELRQLFQLQAQQDGQGLSFEVSQGSQFIPRLTQTLTTPIRSITLRQPTLDDVFLRLTGRELREEEGGTMDSFRDWARRRARRASHG